MKKTFCVRNIAILLVTVTILLYFSGKSHYILSICKYIPYPNILYLSIILTGAYTCFFLLPQLKSSLSVMVKNQKLPVLLLQTKSIKSSLLNIKICSMMKA